MESLKINNSPIEKNVLFEIIPICSRNIGIMDFKTNDERIIEKRNKIWIEINTGLSAVQGTYQHTEKQLRLLWKNMKAKAKPKVTG